MTAVMSAVVVVVAAAVEAMLVVGKVKEDDFQELLIDQRIDKSYRLVSWTDHLSFSCGTCKHSRISPCISWRSDDNPNPPFSWTHLPITDL